MLTSTQTLESRPFTNTFEEIFAKKTSKDPWNNLLIDLRAITEVNEKVNKKAVKEIIQNLSTTQAPHVVLTISQNQTRLYHWIMKKSDFKVHHNEGNFLILTHCVNHTQDKCYYPAYKTMAHGVSIILFNHDLTKFLAVQEKKGQYHGWKAPTGGVDYENGEDERLAASRELQEETGLLVVPEQLKFVSLVTTNAFPGRSPDRNFVFASRCEEAEELTLIPQRKEIITVEWILVDEFLNSELPLNIAERPLVIQEVVRIAQKSLMQNQGWQSQEAYWGNVYWKADKAVQVYSV